MIKATSTDITKEEAKALVVGCFRDLCAQSDEGWFLETAYPDRERSEQLIMSADGISDLSRQRESQSYEFPVTATANALLHRRGIPRNDISPARLLDILDGTARALIEQQRLFQLRLDDRLAPFSPQDPLFQCAKTADPSVVVQMLASQPPHPQAVGPTLGEAIASYLSAKENVWTAKTLVSRRQRLGYLEQHLGGSVRLSAITADHIRSFRDGILKLRRNRGRCTIDEFAKKQTDNASHQISAKTAELIFEPVKAFCRWSKSEQGYIRTNPAEDIRIAVAKKIKGKKSRRPFAEAELVQLFSAPLFAGSQSRHRRFEPGSVITKDAKYWIPILGFYTGSRLGELVQLHLSDVNVSGPIPFIHITEEDSGPSGGGAEKHVKSEAGVRIVPLHPDVMALGFAAFVALRQKAVKSRKRLFPEVKFGNDGQASTVFSKWFGRFLDSVGLSDPALVYHSFRHNAEDAFRNAGQQQYVIDRIIGHTDAATSAGYGDGIDLEVAHAAVCAMKLKVSVAALVKV